MGRVSSCINYHKPHSTQQRQPWPCQPLTNVFVDGDKCDETLRTGLFHRRQLGWNRATRLDMAGVGPQCQHPDRRMLRLAPQDLRWSDRSLCLGTDWERIWNYSVSSAYAEQWPYIILEERNWEGRIHGHIRPAYRQSLHNPGGIEVLRSIRRSMMSVSHGKGRHQTVVHDVSVTGARGSGLIWG